MKRLTLLFLLLALTACGGGAAPTAPAATATTPPAPGASDSSQFIVTFANDLWRLDTATQAKTQLTALAPSGAASQPAVAPDGATIAYAQRNPPPTPTPNEPFVIPTTVVATIPVAGGAPTVVLSTSDPYDWVDQPQWAPDGATLYATYHSLDFDPQGTYSSLEESIIAITPSSGVTETLATNAVFPAPSPDGRWLAYVEPSDSFRPKLMLLDLASNETSVLVDDPSLSAIEAPRWAPDSATVMFVATPAGAMEEGGFWWEARQAAAHGTDWKVWQVGVDGAGLISYPVPQPLEDPRLAITADAIYAWSYSGMWRYDRSKAPEAPVSVATPGDLGGIDLIPAP